MYTGRSNGGRHVSTYVKKNAGNAVVTVIRSYGCGEMVLINRYARVELNYGTAWSSRACRGNARGKGVVAQQAIYEQKTAELALSADCFDPASCCDQREQEMIAAIKQCLRPECAPSSLYERLRRCIDGVDGEDCGCE
ncbi:hypothetical protein B9G54_05035 [Alloscardovia macacae]|uniref:Uncharacterized protein n=1 Tax=Alloscardovia macacae TaxID=1160091 RepID=A0A1Y2STM7_9BIFI|nr:hypothetical protein B9G54_05035 [Alloscardovia macacae]OTA28845.1 hypothetical protein B9T39_05845 [Alloscardovia macacae]